MLTLGLNAFHADASAALFIDGRLAIAIEEERLNRVKHSAGFPALAAAACLREMGLRPEQLDHIAISRDPRARLWQKAWHLIRHGAPASVLKSRLANARRVDDVRTQLARALSTRGLRAPVHAVEHHRAHLASAFFCSPFDEAAVLSIDGFGDFASTMWGVGRKNGLRVDGAVAFPSSLGLLYTAVTQWLGFPHYGDEGKVMGLAPYGQPRHAAVLRRACRLTADAFDLDLSYFTHVSEGVRMSWDAGAPTVGRIYSERLAEELGPPRAPGEPLRELDRDVAASLQQVTEEVIFHLARRLHARTGLSRLCLAGGVALNSVANGKLRESTPFREVYVQPAAGDAGTAIGAALYAEHVILGRPRRCVMSHAALGPAFDDEACAAAVEAAGAIDGVKVQRIDDPTARRRRAVDLLVGGRLLGWFEGRMEFGPRALGQRSVLADPRVEAQRDRLNARVKRRESFRPFAPAVLVEEMHAWFEDAEPSPAMMMVKRFRPEQRGRVPAVAHVDGTGRLQTVSAADAPALHALVSEFFARTGVPMLLNTSFNENEPIVCTPKEALDCFRRTDLDALVLGPFVLERRP